MARWLPLVVAGALSLPVPEPGLGAPRGPHPAGMREQDVEAPAALLELGAAASGNLRNEGNCLKDLDVCVCTCAKCGSTSLYAMIYEGLFGEKWEGADIYSHDRSDPDIKKWINAWQPGGFKPGKDTFTFAVARDPVRRLFSAYRSKVACGGQHFHTDWGGRKKIVPQLTASAAIPELESKTCLSLDEYVDAMYAAHQKVDSANLNEHYMPQTANCFQKGRTYSLVCELGDAACFQKLSAHLRHPVKLPHAHQSRKSDQYYAKHPREARTSDADQDALLWNGLDRERQEKLKAITEDEYRALQGHLKHDAAEWRHRALGDLKLPSAS